jgi:type IV pilus assembly protein PilB
MVREACPVARLVDLIIAEAVRWSATEVRLDPEPTGVRVRHRIGGEWVDRDSLPRRLLEAIVARVRFLADLPQTPDGSEQEGRISGSCEGRAIELAVLVRQTPAGPAGRLTFLPEAAAGESVRS